jgi:hypothetical protein
VATAAKDGRSRLESRRSAARWLPERERASPSLIRRGGANVTNVLPLDDAARFRFWVFDYKKGKVLTALADAGYEPIFTGMSPQICVDTYSMGLVNNFELALERERTPIQDDRIAGELGPREKPSAELLALRKYLGWDK